LEKLLAQSTLGRWENTIKIHKKIIVSPKKWRIPGWSSSPLAFQDANGKTKIMGRLSTYSSGRFSIPFLNYQKILYK
jgi:hypothetical protein